MFCLNRMVLTHIVIPGINLHVSPFICKNIPVITSSPVLFTHKILPTQYCYTQWQIGRHKPHIHSPQRTIRRHKTCQMEIPVLAGGLCWSLTAALRITVVALISIHARVKSAHNFMYCSTNTSVALSTLPSQKRYSTHYMIQQHGFNQNNG